MLKRTWAELTSTDGREELDAYRPLIGSYPKLLAEVLRDSLTATQKRYIILYYKDGLKTAEIAELCEVNKSTVSRTLKRARERLRRAIGCELIRKGLKGQSTGAKPK